MSVDRGPERPMLSALADRVGILPEYIDQSGTERRPTLDETRVAILAAMGLAAADEDAARGSLQRIEREDAEASSAVRDDLMVDGDELYATLRFRGGPPRQHRRCLTPPDLAGDRKLWGIVANLYSLRSHRNWGVGDLTDLGDILVWAGELGAAFVGVSPLHAIRNRGHDISPYSPLSRLFRNPLYLDVETIPELHHARDALAILTSASHRRELDRLRATTRVDYRAVASLKHPILQACHRVFLEGGCPAHPDRAAAYDAYLAAAGGALDDFATFVALEEHLELTDPPPASWHDWPKELRDPGSAAVARFREHNHEAVNFHRYLQFEIDRQLAIAAARGRDAGLAIGLYQDLALGSDANGSDAWAFPHLFANGVLLGAPPDAYAPQGQNWGFPPINPRQLAAHHYDYWINVLRSALRYSGALRVDHILGCFRQFWIPEGRAGSEGAYIRFPTDDLFAILAAESHRSRAAIVGEDLGTVPPEVAPTLERWGVLASKVMFFEREDGVGFRPSSSYPRLSLTTADTHDMATVAGFWTGRDIDLKLEVGMIDERKARELQARRERERQALLDRLAAEGVLAEPLEPGDDAELRGAVHAFLCRSPAMLVGLSLDDIVGEVEPVNVPGVGLDRFPSWTRRLSLPIERFREDAGVRAALRHER